MTLRDSRQVRDGTVLSTDVCVVVGGAAGTTVALELARNRIPTVVEPEKLNTHPRMGAAGLQPVSIRKAPARFAQHTESLQQSDTTDVYIYGNVVDLVGDKEAGRLSRVEVRTLSGIRFAVQARA